MEGTIDSPARFGPTRPMRLLLSALVPLGLCAFAACGGGAGNTGSGGSSSTSTSTGDATTSTSTSGTTSSTTSTGTGGSTHGDCHSDAECMGKPCQPLVPGGYEVCINPIAEATSCNTMDPPNECCTSADCAAKN